MMGCEVTLAHPKGMELDPKIIDQCQVYADTYWRLIQDLK